MSLYFWINLLSLSIPAIVSFHHRIRLYRYWQHLIPGILITMIPYIVWDIYFTDSGYWGFNERYLSGIYLFNLPIEEWLFFICIPYACVFTHVALIEINPSMKLAQRSVPKITIVLLTLFILLMIFCHDKAYTLIDALFAFVVLGLTYLFDRKLLATFYLTFLFMLIPFFAVNGVLTGFGIDQQVVWYNDAENLGIRMMTIPVEDAIYAFSLIMGNLLTFRFLQKLGS